MGINLRMFFFSCFFNRGRILEDCIRVWFLTLGMYRKLGLGVRMHTFILGVLIIGV